MKAGKISDFLFIFGKWPGPVAQSVASLTADQEITSNSSLVPYFHGFDREIFSMVSLRSPLIQEVLLTVTSESICMKYWLTFFRACPGKKCE